MRGEQVRPGVLAAYQIAKAIAAADDKLRSALAPALDFYGRVGRLAAATRAASRVSRRNVVLDEPFVVSF